MKSIYLFFFSFLFVCHFSFAQKKKAVLRNNIKSVVCFESKDLKTSSEGQKSEETFFDENGNLSEQVEYENGKVKSHFKYEYDDEEQKIKEIELNSLGKILKITTFLYDAEGNKIKETESDSSGKILKVIEFEYDGDLRTKRIVKDGNGTIKSQKTYKYQSF